MKLIGYDGEAQGLAIYELDGQRVSIAGSTPPGQIEAAVLAALAALDQPKPARLAVNTLIENHQDLTLYADYFYRVQRDLIALWKTMPNLTDTTTAVYAAVRANKASDPTHQAMYARFLWFLQRTTAITLVSGDLPPTPTAAQAQAINACAYSFIAAGVGLCNLLIQG